MIHMYQSNAMKFSTALDPVFDSVTKVRLLRKLISAPAREWTGRELAKAAGVSTAQAARDLHDLSDAGIVEFEVHGRTFAWHLNHEFALYPQLFQLFQREARLRPDLIHELSLELRSEPIRRARLFGSVARGDERQDSDIDVFLEIRSAAERPKIEDAIARARDRVWKKFGNPLAPLIYTSSKMRRPPNPALMATIDQEGIDIPEVGDG